MKSLFSPYHTDAFGPRVVGTRRAVSAHWPCRNAFVPGCLADTARRVPTTPRFLKSVRRIVQTRYKLNFYAVALCLLANAAKVAQAAPLPGETLPNIELATAQGQTRRAWQPGRVTVISFCAFWCDTWKPQSQRLEASQRALAGLPVNWTMISVDGRWSAKSQDGAHGEVARGALLDAGSRWTHRLDVTSVPFTLVVDGAGKILFTAQGIARAEPLRAAIRVGLGDAPVPNGIVHLAIDDFPSRDPQLDDALLDLLRARGIKANFYGSPSRRQNSPAITSRTAREGHILSGAFPTSQPDVIDPFDFKLVGENELLRRISGALKPGKTLVLRAGVRDTLQILPRLLDSASARGLRFGR